MAKTKFSDKINIKNKRASFEFQFIDTYTAGIMLTGTEIKSIREGNVNLQDGYCIFEKDELWLRQVHISKYNAGTHYNHEPIRDRKLLLTKRELKKLFDKSRDKGLAIIPIRLFISDRGFAKIDIALAKGKKLYDKREDIKKKDVARDLDRMKI